MPTMRPALALQGGMRSTSITVRVIAPCGRYLATDAATASCL
jgi:hypothetical protein